MTRRHELDWLRVLAFLLLIFFHAGMPFVNFGWHINNSETSDNLSHVWRFFHNWRMPLLFMISGAGIWFALGNRNGWQFFKDRCLRLLLPLFFGVLVIVPPQVYLERLSQGVAFDSYISFYPHFFDGTIFSGGNFTPNHLWYIYTLFFCTLLALPLFLFFKSSSGQVSLNKLEPMLSKKGGIYIAAIPIYLSLVLLKPYGMAYVFEFYQLALVIVGFLIVSSDCIVQSIESQRCLFLVAAIIGVSIATTFELSEATIPVWLFYLANVFGYFSLLLAFFGYARHYLNFTNAFLKYTNEAVYPFYILHQTITVILAFHIVQWEMNLWLKFLLTSCGTALFTLVIYHYAIRPFDIMRPLFGLKKMNAIKEKSISTAKLQSDSI